MTADRIYGFDAIRAVSVLLVIASHVGIVEGAKNPTLVEFFSVFNASLGVRCFFVLSGFLITTLLLKEYEKTGRIDVKAFMIRRALRILPLYFLVLLSLWPYFEAGRFWQPINTATYAILFAYNFIPNELNVHYLSHLWSLGVEEQFYIVWPFVFGILAAKRMRLIWLCLGIVALCAARMSLGYGDAELTHAPNRWTIPAIYPIALGAGLAIFIRDQVYGKRSTAVVSSPFALAGGVLLVALPLLNADIPLIDIIGAVGISVCIGWIYTNQQSIAVRALEFRPLVYFGTISYGLYMWQGVLTGNGPQRQLLNFPPDPMTGALLTLPAAVISWHLFEQPILRLRAMIAPHPKTAE
jgi:peptidoglycan/LPS O-acetylase OafA/YrhL